MFTITAKEAKTHFGKLLDDVKRQPALITKNGRPSAYMMAIEDEALAKVIEDSIEDYYLGERAKQAEAEGMVGVEESKRLMAELGDA